MQITNQAQTKSHPALVIEYTDNLEGFKGWLAIDSLCHSMCAGGMRVQPGLSREHLISMAANMTRKMQIAGLRVDGAKCGIDYDPAAPGKKEAMKRFLQAIRPYIQTIYSMGPDLNVEMAELEEAGLALGIRSVKMAIAAAQGWEIDYYLERAAILNTPINDWGWPLGKLRAGYGVAASALAVLKYLKIPAPEATVSLQGFGTLAKATAFGLLEDNCRIIAIADRQKSLLNLDKYSVDFQQLLHTEGGFLPTTLEKDIPPQPSEAITDIKCDILIPAAVENTITREIAECLDVKAVVPGANLAVSRSAQQILHQRDIIVIPDFLAGSGGSLSMEGLFGPSEHPAPTEVLIHVKKRMARMTKEVIKMSKDERTTPTQAALKICAQRQCRPNTRPYGKIH